MIFFSSSSSYLDVRLHHRHCFAIVMSAVRYYTGDEPIMHLHCIDVTGGGGGSRDGMGTLIIIASPLVSIFFNIYVEILENRIISRHVTQVF